MERTEKIVKLTAVGLPAFAALVALLAIGPTALGAGRTSAAPSAGHVKTTTVVVTAGKPSELSFKLSKMSLVPAGKVVFKVTNRGKIMHDFKLCTVRTTTSAKNACVGKVTKLLKPGQSQTLTVLLTKKGKYEFLCTVPGHAAAGMKGLFGVGVKVVSPTAVATSSPSPGTTTPAATTTVTTTTTTTTTPAAPTCGTPQNSTATVSMFEFGYTVTPSTLPCGTVTFNIKNTGSSDHDFIVEGLIGAASRLLGPGESGTLTATIPPGTWTYYCSVPTHRALGMEGKVTITG